MKNTEFKNSICQKIDQLNDSELNEINGIILNYLNQRDDEAEWNKLTEPQQRRAYTKPLRAFKKEKEFCMKI
jgi:hypothetical protein